jgi:hypothetical protein
MWIQLNRAAYAVTPYHGYHAVRGSMVGLLFSGVPANPTPAASH